MLTNSSILFLFSFGFLGPSGRAQTKIVGPTP